MRIVLTLLHIQQVSCQYEHVTEHMHLVSSNCANSAKAGNQKDYPAGSGYYEGQMEPAVGYKSQ